MAQTNKPKQRSSIRKAKSIKQLGKWRSPLRLINFMLLFAIAGVLFLVFSQAATMPGFYGSVEQDHANRVNAARATNGAGSLKHVECLNTVAETWTKKMAESNTLKHNPNLLNEVNAQCGGYWDRLGENVGYGYTSESLFNAYMNSPGHRTNILTSAYSRVGHGAYWTSEGKLWTTQIFVSCGRSCAGNWNVEAALPADPGPKNLIAIRRQGANGRTEAHILNGNDSYKTFSLQVVTALGATNLNEWAFITGNMNTNGFPDLVAVRMNGANSKTEVHILNGATNYQSFKLHVGTALGTTNLNDWVFSAGRVNANGFPDVVAVRMNGANSKTEVHILNGADNYQTFKLHVGSALGTTNLNDWVFNTGNMNVNGFPDLVVVRRKGTNSKTEVHILNGADNYQTFKLHTGTALEASNLSDWSFSTGNMNANGFPDLVGVKYNGTNGKTEVHTLTGANNYQSFNMHTGTALGTTSSASWEFEVKQ